jgi:hypothetical protein
MNQVTIADIDELAKGSPVLKLAVQVKKGFEPGEGEANGRPWKMQAAILKDFDGEIRATFWNRFNLDLRNLEGEDVILLAQEDSKGRISGITVDEYKGKKQLKVEKHVKIDQVTGGPVTEEDVKEVFNATETDELAEQLTPKPSEMVVKNTRFVSEETKRESIEKQVALKAAVDLSAASGEGSPEKIVKLAAKFYDFLHGSA